MLASLLQLSPRTIVLAAVVLRLALVGWNVASRPELFRPSPRALAEIGTAYADPERTFAPRIGFEVGSIAYSIACAGEGFANPFGAGTGPTAWVAPVPVAVYAIAFALFGCFSGGAVLALLAVALAASALTVRLAYAAAGRIFPGERAAPVAGVLAALSPWDLRLFLSGSFLDLNLPGLALLLVVALLLRGCGRATGPRWAAFGAAAALAALVSPVLVLPAAACLGFAIVRGRIAGHEERVRAVALFLLAQVILVGPYAAWQSARIGAWTYVKSNLPFELWLGNHPSGGGVHTAEALKALHPSQSLRELRDYRRLGEAAYVRERGERFVRGLDPGRFARATVWRAVHFFGGYTAMPWEGGWTLLAKRALAVVPALVLIGLPAARRLRALSLGDGAWTVYVAIAAYAAPYLLTGMMERYVAPAIPLVLVLASGFVARGRISAARSRRRGRGSGRS